MMKEIIYKNLLFYWQKTVLVVVLISLLMFLELTSILFTHQIKKLADAPLNSLQTEIILQQDAISKDASTIKTQGVIEPFNLKSFSKQETVERLSHIGEITEVSFALVLWQFDIKNNKTIIGLDINDPPVGIRKIQEWLTPKSKFFSDNLADEVILEKHFAKLFGYTLNGQYKINNKDYKIIGIVDFKEQSNLSNAQVFVAYDTALMLIKSNTPIINQAYVSLSNASLLSEVEKEIRNTLPNFSIITKDRLLKNLSSFNSLLYKFGNYLSFSIGVLALLLILWILKMNRMEFSQQTKILNMIGWGKQSIHKWIFFEISFIVMCSLLFSVVFIIIFYFGVLSNITIGTLLNQNFTL